MEGIRGVTRRASAVGGTAIIIFAAAAGVTVTGGWASAAQLPRSCSLTASSARAAEAKSGTLPAGPSAAAAGRPLPGAASGIDISSHNAEPTWPALKRSGVSFVAIKATEGDYYVNTATTTPVRQPGYAAEATAATAAGLYVMPYAFANPYQGDAAMNVTGNGTGTCQADYAWREIGSVASPAYASSRLMLPVVLDVEQDPYAGTSAEPNADACYGLSPSAMVTWIGQFLTEAEKDTGKRPIVYTNPDFWTQCAGNARSFTLHGTTIPFSDYPLWIANYDVTSPGYPAAWSSPTFWQYCAGGAPPADGGCPSSSADLDYLTPLQQGSVAGTPVTAVQVHALSALNGQAVRYSAPVGGLPPGLSVSGAGRITGWPSTAGTYSVKVTATDRLGATAAASFAWRVKAAADSGTAGSIRQQGGSNKCLGDPSGNTASGTPVDLSTCTGKSSQAWTAVQDATIRVLGHCLAASGAYVLLYPCDGSIADQWLAGTDGSLVDVRYGTCLNGPSGVAPNGTRLTLAACTGSATRVNQHWTRPAAPVVSGVGGGTRCLGAAGAAAELSNCDDDSAQHWLVASNAQLAVQSSNCLTEGGSRAGSAITVTKCANAAAQHWKFVAAGRIADEIESTASGLCVTAPPGATASGTKLILGPCSTALTSTWRVA